LETVNKREKELLLILEATTDGIWQWDLRDDKILLSQKFYAMLGYEPGEFPADFQTWQDMIHPADRECAVSIICDYIAGITLEYRNEFRMKAKCGEYRWIRAGGRIVERDDRGNAVRLIGNHQDITERKAEEEKRKFLEYQLQQAQRMEALGTLAGGIAHDFNNILSSLIGFTELAMRESRADKRLHHLEQVMQASERAKNLTAQILDFSRREEAGKKPLDIRMIIKETLKLLKASLPATILIKPEMTTKPATVLADPTQIHQIMMNLGTNAAHAMREKGGVLQVQLSLIEANQEEMALPDTGLKAGPYVRLKISDTGQGIDPANLDRIFHPFFTTKKQGEGTGLGLSVVYGIVKNHGGMISVKSSPGNGTAFTIYLPYITTGMVAGDKEPSVPSPSGKERILFVDDESAIVDAAAQYLRSMGYDVIATTESLEALKIFHRRPDRIDLVITDMTMPRLTGLELSMEILAIRPGLPIIICSGYNQLRQGKLLKQLGISYFVKKPITLADLNRRVRQVLDKQQEN